ncbi:MAG: hypothetical protein BGO01_08360 [Armatimonadetes bacterium 55-13]|nr:DinB family protein [Armatimonadota bacterium]OJU62481.1 MAG: hypothetical protein BGO01_08360 [Armatimonadetes bacterium 55-13]
MNAFELLTRLTENQIDSLFRAASALPADKLDWQPSANTRSALDQLQEVATALDVFWASFTERKIEWSDEMFAEWKESRSKITSLAELESKTRESTKKLVEFMKGLSAEDLTKPVELPFPGSYTLADVLAYHYWNMSYHEGQITMIGMLLQA